MERLRLYIDPETLARILVGTKCPKDGCNGTIGFSYKANSNGNIIPESIILACGSCHTNMLSNELQLIVKPSETLSDIDKQ